MSRDENREQEQSRHDVVWKDVKKTAVNLLETDDVASVFSKPRVLRSLRRNVRAIPDRKLDGMVEHRQEEDISRRTFLKLLGFGASGAVISASGVGYFMNQKIFDGRDHVTGYASVGGMTFDTVLNAVDDLGMDPNGNSAVDGIIESNVADNTLIEFPPGEYLWTDFIGSPSPTNWGFRGTGSSHTDAQFVFPTGGPAEKRMFWFRGDGFVWQNMSLQFTEDSTTGADFVVSPQNQALIEDIEWLGLIPDDDTLGHNQILGVDVSSTDGVFTIRRPTVLTGGEMPGYPNGTAGIRVNAPHNGEVIIENADMRNMGSSPFRSTHPEGVLTVRGGFFKNNCNTNLRLGAGDHPTKVSSIRSSTVVLDGNVPSGRSLTSTQAVRLDTTGNGYGGTNIEDCDIIVGGDIPITRGVIDCPGFGEHQGFTVRNSRIQNDAGGNTVSVTASGGTALFEGCHFIGNGGDISNSAKDGILRDCCIDMPNADVTGWQEENVSRSGCTSPDAEPTRTASSSAENTSSSGATNTGNLC